MKPVAWIKIRELSYMKAVAEHGKDDWQTNLGLKPEPDDEGLYTETQVQRMIELLERCENMIRQFSCERKHMERGQYSNLLNFQMEVF